MHKRICTPQIAMRKRQLSFGFCLTFDRANYLRSDTIKVPFESQLPFGFCLTFDMLGNKQVPEKCTKGKSQLPFGFCLTFDLLQ